MRHSATDKVHLSRSGFNGFETAEVKQEVAYKPRGLWYGIGDSWIEWCASEQPNWIHDNWYRFNVDESMILKLTPGDLDAFTDKYGTEPRGLSYPGCSSTASIDWPRIAKKYDGVEISPYSWEHRLKLMWYYGWDCASGCIWRRRALIGFERVDKVPIDEVSRI